MTDKYKTEVKTLNFPISKLTWDLLEEIKDENSWTSNSQAFTELIVKEGRRLKKL